MPRFTIVTITFNCADYLASSLDSVAAQGRDEVEHIVVDGGSTDGTLDLLRSREDHLSWKSEPDRGISDAMNKGLERATGDFVAFVHADDLLLPGALDHLDTMLERDPRIEWIVGPLVWFDEKSRFVMLQRYHHGAADRLAKGNHLPHPGAFVRRERILEVGGFDEDLKLAMDYDLWNRLVRDAGIRPVVAQRPLAAFRVHTSSASNADPRTALREAEDVRTRYHGRRPHSAALLAVRSALATSMTEPIGLAALTRGDRREAAALLREAIRRPFFPTPTRLALLLAARFAPESLLNPLVRLRTRRSSSFDFEPGDEVLDLLRRATRAADGD